MAEDLRVDSSGQAELPFLGVKRVGATSREGHLCFWYEKEQIEAIEP